VQDAGEDDWMSRYFFTGGTMPSIDLLTRFQEHLTLEDMWWVKGMKRGRKSRAKR
jgi:cyclopropane fatty-acyl-phospholipid synthase-like methyltransferase